MGNSKNNSEKNITLKIEKSRNAKFHSWSS